MFEQLNSRIQLAAASSERYRTLLNTKFDFVVGNPPWGGVLKGPLAPVYDEAKKQRFKREYPNAASGKYDIYDLFIERAHQILAWGGRFAMITQDTYLDKEWARKLRRLLSTKATIHTIVDLNPFGQLFFHAMNTPAVTVFDAEAPKDGNFRGVVTTAPRFEEKDQERRRELVLSTVRRGFDSLSGRRRQAMVEFVTAARLPRRVLQETSETGWYLKPVKSELKFKRVWVRITDILEPRQGVTPGGCLDVFLMDQQRAQTLSLENNLVHRAIKTRETDRWFSKWQGRVLLYPYTLEEGQTVPAFTVKHPGLMDAPDFEVVRIGRGKLGTVALSTTLPSRTSWSIESLWGWWSIPMQRVT